MNKGNDKIQIYRFGKEQLKHKKGRVLRAVIISVVLLTAIILASLKIEYVIRNNIMALSVSSDANATWIGSLASYWGGILGGVFSGTIAIVGVFYTIRFTREADRNKERQSIQPFLNIEIATAHPNGKNFYIGDEPKFVNGKAEREYYPISLSIKNIGNGFANTLTFETGRNLTGEEYKTVFTVNEEKYITLNVQTSKVSKGIEFFIWFADSMTNEYIQRYELKQKENGTGYDLDIGYPDLIE